MKEYVIAPDLAAAGDDARLAYLLGTHASRRAGDGRSAVYFAPIADREQVNNLLLRIEFVDDAVVADAQAKLGSAFETLMRILAQPQT